MSPPILHDFTYLQEFLKSISQNFKFDISENWVVHILKNDDVVWNIVLAYLNSFPSSKKEITRLLMWLADRLMQTKNLKNFVKIINPFLHRTACCSDEFTINLVKTFKNRLENWIHNADNSLEILSEKEKYLEASSRFLECNIIVITILNKENIEVDIFPKLPPHFIHTKYILLLHYFGRMKSDRFCYCIPKKEGIFKQKIALIEILKKAAISKNVIQKIYDLPHISENFLITLLKSNLEQNVQLMFKSSYVLSKLSDAGFETDPRQKDSEGKSALYYALMKDESNLLFFLYDHAANACLQEQGSVRSPNSIIVENLFCLKDSLLSLEEDVKSSDLSEQSKHLSTLDELQQFNKFQIEICGKIINVRQKINYYSEAHEEFEALQRRDIILNILEAYRKYFASDNIVLNSKDSLSLFEKYYQNRNYFDKLDFCSAVMFFDNLFLLKERLKLVDNAYLEIESKFFLFIFCERYLKQYDHKHEFAKESRWITFQEQLSLQKHLSTFKKFLLETEISDENLLSSIPETDVYTLINLPEIYGQFLLYRLQNYLDTVAKIKIINAKSILIIERTLQIIGESLKESNFKSIQKVLSQALPSEFVTAAKHIRDNLIHFKPSEVLYRNTVQHDTILFTEIKKELTKFRKLLLPIQYVHKYQINQFLISMLLKSLLKARKHEKNRKEIVQKGEAGNLQGQKSAKQQLLSSEVNNSRDGVMYKSLQNEIKILNQNVEFLTKSAIHSYEYVLKNLISAVKVELNRLKSESLITDQDKEKLDEFFWSFECVLICLTKDKKLKDYRRRLLNGVKSRECLFSGIREKKRYSRKVNNCFNRNTSKISNVEAPIATPSYAVRYTEPYDELYNKEAQNNKHNVIMLEGASNYRNASVVKENEKRISIDVFEDLDFRTFFTCDSSNYKCSDGKEEKGSFDAITDVPTAPLSINENKDKNLFEALFDDTSHNKTLSRSGENKEISHPCVEDSKTELSHQTVLNNVMHNEWNLEEVFNISQDFFINDEVKDLEVQNNGDASNILIKTAETIVADYEVIMKDIFEENRGYKVERFSFKNIKKYWMILAGEEFLIEKNEKRNTILNSVPEQFQNISFTKQKLETLLKKEKIIPEEIDKELDKLPMKDKEKKEIIKDVELGFTPDVLYTIKSIPDYFSELKLKIAANKINKVECNIFCDRLQIPNECKKILLQLISGKVPKASGNMFQFLRHRIKLLKKILIDENENIKELWENATSWRKKKYLHDKLVQIYVSDPEIQASVEMLLSDCMNILNTKKLQTLWLKTNNLFNGISLRNVISHGNPLLESLGRLLDPNDLPFELVGKMSKLISDEPAIDCMQQILEQTKYPKSKFMELMDDNENIQFEDLRKKIKECKRWKKYAVLIPAGKATPFSGIQYTLSTEIYHKKF
ncbi:uncharacterized protein NPIL_150791 [Nephila pilipes]|uniref:Uncharacterized protein n=1 Tax=Nephila pilipes TaxID=299642 RepID=A0A8X6NKN9_NEPPI|nr:uncharacterized protein NPIL_150791 [Nephila pilipes]